MNQQSAPEWVPTLEEMDTARVCYTTAYTTIPHHLYNHCAAYLADLLAEPKIAFGCAYYLAAQLRGIEPLHKVYHSFQCLTGELTDALRFHLIQYPTPPDVKYFPAFDVLPPYFSAIVTSPDRIVRGYFILGQAPESGTTLRTVTPDGANRRVGVYSPYSNPNAFEFIGLLRSMPSEDFNLAVDGRPR